MTFSWPLSRTSLPIQALLSQLCLFYQYTAAGADECG